MRTVRDTLSTMGYTQCRGDIMMNVGGYYDALWGNEYCGGYNLLLFECPHSTEHPLWHS